MTLPDPTLVAQVRQFVEGNMGSQVKVVRGARGQFDPATGLVGGLADVRAIYLGPARIRSMSGSTVVIGEATVDTAQTVITIPIAAPMPHRDDLVLVLDNVDLEVATRTFHVDSVESSGFWADAHRMTCSTWVESSRWGE